MQQKLLSVSNHHLHIDAWDDLSAEASTCPVLADAHPTGIGAIAFCSAVPWEPYFDTTVFVWVDFFSLWPCDDGDLCSVYSWARGRAMGRCWYAAWECYERVGLLWIALIGLIASVLCGVSNLMNDMLFKRIIRISHIIGLEASGRREGSNVARTLNALMVSLCSQHSEF